MDRQMKRVVKETPKTRLLITRSGVHILEARGTPYLGRGGGLSEGKEGEEREKGKGKGKGGRKRKRKKREKKRKERRKKKVGESTKEKEIKSKDKVK